MQSGDNFSTYPGSEASGRSSTIAQRPNIPQPRLEGWKETSSTVLTTVNQDMDVPPMDGPSSLSKPEGEKHLDALQLITRENIQGLQSKLKRAQRQLAYAKEKLWESEAAEQAAQQMRMQAQQDIDQSDLLIEKSEAMREDALQMMHAAEEKEAKAREQWWTYEQSRQMSEADRAAAEQDRKKVDQELQSIESQRYTVQAARQEAEKKRKQADEKREAAESVRMDAHKRLQEAEMYHRHASSQWQGAESKRLEAEKKRDEASVKKQQADKLWQDAIKKRQQAQVQHDSAEHVVLLASQEGWGSVGDEPINDPYETPEISEPVASQHDGIQNRSISFDEEPEREERRSRRLDRSRSKRSLFSWTMNTGVFVLMVGIMWHVTLNKEEAQKQQDDTKRKGKQTGKNGQAQA